MTATLRRGPRWLLEATVAVLLGLSPGLAACASKSIDSVTPNCAAELGLSYVCGAEKPEDLARLPDTKWIVASGFSPGAGLKLIDTRTRRMRQWFTGQPGQVALDRKRFPDCALPPERALFNARGISFRERGLRHGDLFVVNHGGREAIEVFSVDASTTSSEPRLQWRGCLMLPAGHVGNSVASYRDGTVLVTVLTRPGTSITDFVLGHKTGIVIERGPRDREFREVPGTELEGNNGLETSPADDAFYVVAFGPRQVVRFERGDPSRPTWRATAPEFMPDNIHWHGDRLLAAGMVRDEPACGGARQVVHGLADGMTCHRGYVVALLDPATQEWRLVAYGEPSRSFNGVSSALMINDELWLGSYQADRVAVRSLPSAYPSDKNEPVR